MPSPHETRSLRSRIRGDHEMSSYVRNCALGGLVALLTGFVSGFLSA